MSKNSFTQNFNNCVAGLPIASVAAHMVLHEGLGKDLLKIGVPAAIIAGLYNYGDDMATGISNWGKEHEDMKLGNWNIGQTAQTVGNKLNDWHNAGTHWMQDTAPGKWVGLGGEEAAGRQAYEKAFGDAQVNITKSYNDDVANYTKQRDDGKISYDDWNKKVAEAGQLRDQRLGNAQLNAAQDMRDQMTHNKMNPNAYNPQMVQFSNGQMTNNPYQQQGQPQGQQPQPQGQQPQQPQQPQGQQPQQQGQAPISKPLPDANRAAVGGALAGFAGGRAYASGGQPAQAQQPAPAASTAATAVQNSVNAVNRGANAAPSTSAASVQTTANAVNQGVNATQSAGRASGTGYDFSEQDKLKNMKLGSKFIQDPNTQNPSPFRQKPQVSKTSPSGGLTQA